MTTSDKSIVELNVGGTSFLTFHDTLIKSKYFANLLNNNSMTSKTITNKGENFIDRSGDLFRDIIYYLRTGSVTSKNKKRLGSLRKEAGFYQLKELVEAVRCEEQIVSKVSQDLQFFVRYTDFWTILTDASTKCIAVREADGITRVYQVVGRIDEVAKKDTVISIITMTALTVPRIK